MNKCGSYVIQQEGRYGLLSCSGDDPLTSKDEGAVQDENITFTIDGKNAVTQGTPSWQPGVLTQVDLFVENIKDYEPILETPSSVDYTQAKTQLIKVVSIIGSIVLIILFLMIYKKQ